MYIYDSLIPLSSRAISLKLKWYSQLSWLRLSTNGTVKKTGELRLCSWRKQLTGIPSSLCDRQVGESSSLTVQWSIRLKICQQSMSLQA